jgi:type I restriction enzyme S subunit
MDILQLNAPSKWKVSTVGESYIICNQLREPISATVRESMKGEYPYYGPTQVVDYLDHYRLDGKYALIGEDGDHFLKYATRPMTQLATGKFNVNNHAHIIQNTEECSVEWFYYFFMHTSIFPFLTRQGAGRYKLNKAALEQIPILIPPLAEQRKIAEILSTWDEAIDLTEQLIAAKQRRKQALMQRLLTGQVRFPGFEGYLHNNSLAQVGFIPSGWRIVRLKECLTEKPTYGANSPSIDYTPDLPRYIRITDIKDGSTLDIDKKVSVPINGNELYVLEDGDFLFARSGATVGKTYLYREQVGWAIYAGYLIRFRLDDHLLIPSFLKFYTQSKSYWDWVKSTIRAGAQPNINAQEYSDLPILLPSISEQRKIVEFLETCDDELTLHQQKLAALRRQKQGLMQPLLTGRVRVAG